MINDLPGYVSKKPLSAVLSHGWQPLQTARIVWHQPAGVLFVVPPSGASVSRAGCRIKRSEDRSSQLTLRSAVSQATQEWWPLLDVQWIGLGELWRTLCWQLQIQSRDDWPERSLSVRGRWRGKRHEDGWAILGVTHRITVKSGETWQGIQALTFLPFLGPNQLELKGGRTTPHWYPVW